MGFDFKQYLGTYVPFMQIRNYDESSLDVMILVKFKMIFDETFGKDIFNFTCLKLTEEDEFHNVYVYYDKDKYPYSETEVYKMAMSVLTKLTR